MHTVRKYYVNISLAVDFPGSSVRGKETPQAGATKWNKTAGDRGYKGKSPNRSRQPRGGSPRSRESDVTEAGSTGRGRDELWRLLDGVGLEHCRLMETPDGPVISGVGVTVVEGAPATIDYSVRCDRLWHTRDVSISLLIAGTATPVSSLSLISDGDGSWWRSNFLRLDSTAQPITRIAGCIDIDLAFTPATNTLPIRRHDMTVGANVEVAAAWVQFPSLELAVLRQRFHRIEPGRYRYEAQEHNFSAMLDVDEFGLIRTYEGLWERIAQTDVKAGAIHPIDEVNDA